MHRALGIERGIIVQPTTYGADHQVTLDGLAALGPNYKACANAVVLSERDDAYIAAAHAMRGARFTRAGLGLALSPEAFGKAVARARARLVREDPARAGRDPRAGAALQLELPVLIDHMGRANPAAGAQDPSRSKLVELLGRSSFWVMLSLGEKISRAGPPWTT